VSLYLLLLEERYGQQLDMGLLWYLNDQVMVLTSDFSFRFYFVLSVKPIISSFSKLYSSRRYPYA